MKFAAAVVLLAALLSPGGLDASSIKFELDNSGNQADVLQANGAQALLAMWLFRSDNDPIPATSLQVQLETTGNVSVKNLVLFVAPSSDGGDNSGGALQVLGVIPNPGPTNTLSFAFTLPSDSRVDLQLFGQLTGTGTLRVNVPPAGLSSPVALPEEAIIGRLLQVNAAAGVVPEEGTFAMFAIGCGVLGFSALLKRRRV
jgi:hypothetical protein